MGSYRVLIRPAAKRELRGLSSTNRKRIWNKLLSLAETPRPRGIEKLEGSTNEYRLRVGTYRVLLVLDDAKGVVEIFRVAHRRDAYRKR